MAKSRHTQGPWRFEEHSPNRILAPHGETVAAVYGGFTGIAEQVSNVRLVTAAPAMYEYIERKAADGDQEAQTIVSAVGGP